MSNGTLHLIPNTLGLMDASLAIPEGVLEVARNLVYYIAEDERTARRFLKSINTRIPLNDLQFTVLNKHTVADMLPSMCAPLLSGTHMGLISEAGLPAIADPGAAVVAWCHQHGVQVVPYAGPSSIVLALVASGFNGQQFTFHGYLPIESKERVQALKHIEREASRGSTQIFMETPFRNMKLFEQILVACRPDTMLSIACDLTLEEAFIHTADINYWKKNQPALHKRPCIFSIGTLQ